MGLRKEAGSGRTERLQGMDEKRRVQGRIHYLRIQKGEDHRRILLKMQESREDNRAKAQSRDVMSKLQEGCSI